MYHELNKISSTTFVQPTVTFFNETIEQQRNLKDLKKREE